MRGPQELHSLRRAVTAQDFELVALRSSGAVARAKALHPGARCGRTRCRGSVEVLLVPYLPPNVQGPSGEGVTQEPLRQHETDEARARIRRRWTSGGRWAPPAR